MAKNEIILDNNKYLKTVYGNPALTNRAKVFYLRFKGKVTPSILKPTYETDILKLKDKVGKKINRIIKNNIKIDNDFIYTFDISEKNIKFKRISNLKLDVFVKPTNIHGMDYHKKTFEKIAFEIEKYIVKELTKINIEVQ